MRPSRLYVRWRLSPRVAVSCRRHGGFLGACTHGSSDTAACSFRRSWLSTSSQEEEGPLLKRYQRLVKNEGIHSDSHQLDALQALERLRHELQHQYKPPAPAAEEGPPSTTGNSLLGNWFGRKAVETAVKSMTGSSNAPRGVYLHGGVGCGKTMLMNLFYDSLNDETTTSNEPPHPWANEKQKIHFHKFMLRVHQDMHAARTQGTNQQKPLESDTILPAVIQKTVAQGRLLCLDEFQVTDVADALILQRLFTGLWEEGCVVVATSNRPPDELYLNGLQRDRFLPFIDLLEKKCQVVSMWDLEKDYRLIQKIESGTVPVYFAGQRGVKGTSSAAQAEFDTLFYELVGKSRAVAPTTLQPSKQGSRKVRIPQASLARGIARFTFEDLCQKALGAADYLTIGHHFHTVFVERMPILTLNEINWVRRFITFVDSMYESNVKLILHSRLPLKEIFERPTKKADGQDDGDVDDYQDDEVFAFDRTLSRLEEMSSQTYLQKRWAGAPDVGDGPAALLSQHRAVVSMEPSLGDDPQKQNADEPSQRQ